MKLKTLKDLTFENSLVEQYPIERINMFNLDCVKTELRQEAKKWIKEIAKGENIDLRYFKIKSITSEKYEVKVATPSLLPTTEEKLAVAQIGWIKHFFNLEAKSKDEM